MMNLSKYIFLPVIVLILHIVGAIGTVFFHYTDLFIALTPLNLLLTTALLLYGHQHINKKVILGLVLCSCLGYAIEVVGVKTGWPFGAYTYGEVLGFKLLGVPLIIGFNWFLLSYCFYLLTSTLAINSLFKSAIAAFGMVLLDLLIEPVAIVLGYWSWQSHQIPITNYAAWFCIAIVFQIALNRIKSTGPRSLALIILLSQFIYFCAIFIFKV